MKVLVTGVSGQLGWDVCRELERREIDHVGVSSRDFDLADPEAVRRYVMECAPDVVIHCAAYTAVDRAEEEPERCRTVNVDGPRSIAAVCKEIGAKMLYVSTDYVFSGAGERFYEPEDSTGPLGVYGETKLDGELAVQELLDRCFIVRISWVFGKNGKNFVRTMLGLAETKTEVNVVCDQVGSPTYTVDLAPLLCDMIATDKYGVYHATNEGVCSWAEFAREIFRLAGKDVRVNAIPSSEYPTRAVRPLNSRMSKDKLERMGFARLPAWQDALERYLREIKNEQI